MNTLFSHGPLTLGPYLFLYPQHDGIRTVILLTQPIMVQTSAMQSCNTFLNLSCYIAETHPTNFLLQRIEYTEQIGGCSIYIIPKWWWSQPQTPVACAYSHLDELQVTFDSFTEARAWMGFTLNPPRQRLSTNLPLVHKPVFNTKDSTKSLENMYHIPHHRKHLSIIQTLSQLLTVWRKCVWRSKPYSA